MRVGIVSEYTRPWPGGISEHVHHEATELVRLGHEVCLITGPAPDDWVDPFPTVRLPRAALVEGNGAASRLSYGPELTRLRRVFDEQAVDVVHVHAPLDPMLSLFACLASNRPTVGTFHASFRPSAAWWALFRLPGPLMRRAWSRLHTRIAVSPEARRSISAYFPGEYTILPNGIDTRRFRPDVAPLHPSAAPTILFVGRPDPRKGLPHLLQAFGMVREHHPDARLLLAGVKDDDIDVPEGATCGGWVPPEDLPAWFTSADVVCAPSLGGESQGIVLLEAMASGRPVVAYDIDGYRDVVNHDVDGWLVPTPGDEQGLADILVRLLGDAGLRERLSLGGLATAATYDWSDIGRRLESIFLDALDANQGVASPGSARP